MTAPTLTTEAKVAGPGRVLVTLGDREYAMDAATASGFARKVKAAADAAGVMAVAEFLGAKQ